jgi:hypothetical protein
LGRLAATIAVAAALCACSQAAASQLVARDVAGATLAVDAGGTALVTYTTPGGSPVRLLAWGAVDAIPPTAGASQLRFRLDYSGGYKTFGRHVWKRLVNACRPYDGPPLAWAVAACRAPDGSYWALQAWQRGLPSFGRPPTTALQRAVELRLSHWSGELPRLEIWQDWRFPSRLARVFGRYTYRGAPVYGFAATPAGAPKDGFGRNVYVDTLDSGYGPGWQRANGFLTHQPTGVFCSLIGSRALAMQSAAGWGRHLRITVLGPGVTPDVYWEGPALPRYDTADATQAEHDRQMNALVASLGDAACKP